MGDKSWDCGKSETSIMFVLVLGLQTPMNVLRKYCSPGLLKSLKFSKKQGSLFFYNSFIRISACGPADYCWEPNSTGAANLGLFHSPLRISVYPGRKVFQCGVQREHPLTFYQWPFRTQDLRLLSISELYKPLMQMEQGGMKRQGSRSRVFGFSLGHEVQKTKIWEATPWSAELTSVVAVQLSLKGLAGFSHSVIHTELDDPDVFFRYPFVQGHQVPCLSLLPNQTKA